uniref:Uncharacterized protein n=1 Tax=Sarcophilus harrisii TaxID=9305 RepID=G3VBK5_SARHA
MAHRQREPHPTEYNGANDSCEILDLIEYARKHYKYNHIFGHSSRSIVEIYSVVTQIIMGLIPGGYVRFLFQKVGKYSNYFLQIQSQEIIKQNIVIANRFVGGFLLGFTS